MQDREELMFCFCIKQEEGGRSVLSLPFLEDTDDHWMKDRLIFFSSDEVKKKEKPRWFLP